MEDRGVSGVELVGAECATDRDHVHRQSAFEQRAHLHRRGVGTQQLTRTVRRDVEGVLFTAGRVVGGEIQRVQVELLGFAFGPLGKFPSHRDERVGDVLGQDRDRMARAGRLPRRGQSHVDTLGDQQRGVALGGEPRQSFVVAALDIAARRVHPLAGISPLGLGHGAQRLSRQRHRRAVAEVLGLGTSQRVKIRRGRERLPGCIDRGGQRLRRQVDGLVNHAATLSFSVNKPCQAISAGWRHGVTRRSRSYVVTLAAIGSRQPDFSPPVRAAASERRTLEYFRGVATPQAPELVPAQYLLSPRASDPRTLIDILYDTAACYPEAAAIDDGTVQLTYSELVSDIEASVAWLAARGIRRGDRIGIRMPSGSFALYEAILATLAVGAAYVPVDADDPDERAELVFGEANVVAIVSEAGMARGPGSSRGWRAGAPLPRDDAWIIFTSGSTGIPKGVAVTHRSAAAFVDAEAQMFLQDNPIGPGDRVLAGLSVAFDASCEEMWLAWRHGACLVPAPRSLVRSGMDLGPWLVSRDVTVVSTVPSLATLWPSEALEAVRLLIFGGEACPLELAGRLAVDGREVWNTYGPTEATVVACAARLGPAEPISIGLPLAGWDLAVVDSDGSPVDYGAVGELVIGGVGLARYLDKQKDSEKYAAMPTLGWSRAYRSGDLVRLERDGLYFVGRADDQVKVGGRRIELGEGDAALVHLPGVSGGAAAVRHTA